MNIHTHISTLESLSCDQKVKEHPAFPDTFISDKRLKSIFLLSEELGVKPEFASEFMSALRADHTPLIWSYEFTRDEVPYLIARLGSRLVIVRPNFAMDISHLLQQVLNTPREAEQLINNSNGNHQTKLKALAQTYSRFLEQMVLELFSKPSTVLECHSFYAKEPPKTKVTTQKKKPLSLSGYSSVWTESLAYYSSFEIRLQRMKSSREQEDFFAALSESHDTYFKNIKALNKRFVIERKKETKYWRIQIAMTLQKIKKFYRPEVISTLYRMHYFDYGFANWLSHDDPRVRLYRKQAAESQPLLLPYFHGFFISGEPRKISRKSYWLKEVDITPDDDIFSFDADQKIIKKIEPSMLSSIFAKIDEGQSVVELLLEAFKQTSSLTFLDAKLHSELEPLLITGLRRLQKKSPRFFSCVHKYVPHADSDTMMFAVVQLACWNNQKNLVSRTKLNELFSIFSGHGPSLDQTSFFSDFFKNTVPNPKNPQKNLSFKEWFSLTFKNKNNDFIASVAYYLGNASDSLHWVIQGNPVELRTDRNPMPFLASRYSLVGLKNWCDDIHDEQQRFIDQKKFETLDSSFEWVPLLKKRALSFKTLTIKELNSNLELQFQGKSQTHCVGTYSLNCLSGKSRIFSIQEGSHILSTLELKQTNGKWNIAQHRAMNNQSPSKEAEHAAKHLMNFIKKEALETNRVPLLSEAELSSQQEKIAQVELAYRQEMHQHLNQFCQQRHPGLYADLISFLTKS